MVVFNWNAATSLHQVLVPRESSLPDYTERVFDVAEKLSEFEERPIEEIVTDLLNYESDVLRFRIASQRTERGTLPLTQAFDLISGAKQLLLSAAHSVLSPLKHHPKLSKTPAVKLVEACQMEQTEQKSFVIAISCPLRAIDVDEAGVTPDRTPFARKATLLLSRALATLDVAIETDQTNRIVDEQNPIVSANLCKSLLQMRPLDDHGLLDYTASWAPAQRLDDSSNLAFDRIRFTQDEFESIEDVYRQLQPSNEPQTQPWIAFVDELRGLDTDAGVRAGEVLLTLFEDGELVRAKAELTVEQYQLAVRAHNPTRPIKVAGQLHRGPRVSRLRDITSFQIVD